ncbi:hypothetical protein [Oceanobacillus oncorhynchi]|nr:hypothetical protein [Oceanobacillus oncorhynchi]
MKLDIKDILAFLGVALIATGAGLIFIPLVPIIVGAFLLWLGIGGEQ